MPKIPDFFGIFRKKPMKFAYIHTVAPQTYYKANDEAILKILGILFNIIIIFCCDKPKKRFKLIIKIIPLNSKQIKFIIKFFYQKVTNVFKKTSEIELDSYSIAR